MSEAVVVTKGVDTKKAFLPTKNDKSAHFVRNEPGRQLSSLRRIIGDIRRDGGTLSIDRIATELSGMHATERASVLLALQRTHGNQYVQRVMAGVQAELNARQPRGKYEQEADRVADDVMRTAESEVHSDNQKREWN